MSDVAGGPVAARLERLEAQVESLQRRLDALTATGGHRRETVPSGSAPSLSEDPVSVSEMQGGRRALSPSDLATRRVRRETRARRSTQRSSLKSVLAGSAEGLLNKVGIALLLLGVVFLFKYSVDQGWITESVRVLFGAVIGLGLLVLGFRVRGVRPHLAPVLLGGGIAALYTTVFAAFQMYALISHPIAFGCMVSITATAFLISVIHRDVWLSLIAVSGGFATPFLLHTGAASLAPLIGYTCVVMAGAASIYTFSGWRSLLYASAIGALVVMLVAFFEIYDGAAPTSADQVVMQLGVGFTWLTFAAAPVVWEMVRRVDPQSRVAIDQVLERPSFLFAWTTPLIAVVFSQGIWELSASWGWISLGLGLTYFGASVALHAADFEWLAESHRFGGALLIPVGLLYLLDDGWLLFALAVFLTATLPLARSFGDSVLQSVLQVALVLNGLALASQMLVGPAVSDVLFDSEAVATLLALLVTGAGPLAWGLRRSAGVFALGGHLLLLLWLLQEVGPLPNGAAWTTMVAAVYAMALLVVGLRWNMDIVRTTALLTILGVVAKLLIFDLAELDALWRILLFLGFGGVLLLLSYFVPNLWRRQRTLEREALPASGP